MASSFGCDELSLGRWSGIATARSVRQAPPRAAAGCAGARGDHSVLSARSTPGGAAEPPKVWCLPRMDTAGLIWLTSSLRRQNERCSIPRNPEPYPPLPRRTCGCGQRGGPGPPRLVSAGTAARALRQRGCATRAGKQRPSLHTGPRVRTYATLQAGGSGIARSGSDLTRPVAVLALRALRVALSSSH
jgi:hypothetical protein